jgi:predicted metal-dependent hydrolase
MRKKAVATRACLDLPDGRKVDFEIRRSARSRSVYFRINPREGLLVSAPRGMGHGSVLRMVSGKAAWIARHLSRYDAVRHLASRDATVRPGDLDLPALAESWRVEYKALPGGMMAARPVTARTGGPGLIVVTGSVDDVGACHGALRRWLARRASNAFSPWLEALARQAGLRYTNLSIRNQRARWGSCAATSGRISLNCKLLFLPRELANYVMVHELCHLLEANHSHRFWAHVRRLEPETELFRRRMHDAWAQVPEWANGGR